LHILMISDVYYPRVNGVSTSIQTFRSELARLGCRVTLIVPEYAGAADPAAHGADDEDTLRVPASGVLFDPEDRMLRWRALGQALNRADPAPRSRFDLVHVQTPFVAHYAGLRHARRHDLPCVATYHTLFEEYLHHYLPVVPRAVTARLARSISRAQCNALDGVIVPSSAMSERLRAYGVEVPLPILPTGIDLQRLSGGDGARFRALYGIAPGQPTLVCIGRVAFEKNLDFLLRMMAVVVAQWPAHPAASSGAPVLVICGEGPAVPALKRQARALGIESNLRFVGYLDRSGPLLDCYCAGDLFVFASGTETQGLVLLEAMALGVPVVSTAVMGTRDVLREGQGATIVPEDERAFAATVVHLLRDPAARAQIAARARPYAQTWSASAMAGRLAQWYADVIERRRAGSAGRENVRPVPRAS
jgi:glycosyltransferase involved in cell wall biosynthesis